MKSIDPRAALAPFALALAAVVGCSSAAPDVDGAALQTARSVDRPGQPIPARNTAGPTMQYYGGPVIPNPKVYVVWWGNPANLPAAVTAAHGGIADFFAGVTNSNYMDWLNEYNTTIPAQVGSHVGQPGTNQRIGRGNYVSTLTLTNIPAGNVTDAQVQSTLDQAFTAGTLPPPDENTIYAVYFPRSVSISLPDGSTSCGAFGAYHEAIVETTRHNAYYLVMPDCGGSFSSVTSVSSHELVEATTDAQPTPGSSPNYPQAWNNSTGSEVGDLCNSSSGTVNTAFGAFNVQGIWDEKSQSCQVFRNDAQDFNVSVSPNTATLASGASGTYTIQTASVAGGAQTLSLSVTAPAGMTASISPSSVAAGGTATLTVSAGTASGSGLQVVVRADGAGAETHTAALLVQVAGAVTNDFSLSATPASATTAQGGSAAFTVATAVTRGSAQSVALSVSGLPTGATGSFTPTSVTAGASATLNVAVGTGTAPGTYSLQITGAGASASHQTSVSLTITGPVGGGSLTNGDFETGTLAGWTSTGTTAAVSGGHAGAYAARVGSTAASTDSSIAQTFKAPAGATQLGFFYKVVCPDTVTYDWATATLADTTAGTTVTMLTKTCTNSGAWVQATASVVAGHTYTLTLSNHDDNYSGDPTYTLFDDVAFGGAPPPPPPPPPPAGLVNGNFASGLTGWTVTGTCSAVSGGAQCGSTAPTNGDSSLSQTFGVPAGATTLSLGYQVTCPDSVTYDWATATLKDNVSGTTTTLLAKTCTNTGTSQTLSANVASSAGHSVTLTLTNHDDNYAGDATYTKFSNVAVR